MVDELGSHLLHLRYEFAHMVVGVLGLNRDSLREEVARVKRGGLNCRKRLVRNPSRSVW